MLRHEKGGEGWALSPTGCERRGLRVLRHICHEQKDNKRTETVPYELLIGVAAVGVGRMRWMHTPLLVRLLVLFSLLHPLAEDLGADLDGGCQAGLACGRGGEPTLRMCIAARSTPYSLLRLYCARASSRCPP